MAKPRLLDLFCGAGGAGMGYHRAGFEVVGVDIVPQPNYPFEFHQADALEYVAVHGHEFDVIHASPPCQRYSDITPEASKAGFPDLIAASRWYLSMSGKPYVIENVRGAAKLLIEPITLCGWAFGLKTYRHRYFETYPKLTPPAHLKHPETCPPSGRGKSPVYGIISVTGNGGAQNLGIPYLQYMPEAMGINWMSRSEVSESIPPAYTAYLGRQLMQYVLSREASLA